MILVISKDQLEFQPELLWIIWLSLFSKLFNSIQSFSQYSLVMLKLQLILKMNHVSLPPTLLKETRWHYVLYQLLWEFQWKPIEMNGLNKLDSSKIIVMITYNYKNLILILLILKQPKLNRKLMKLDNKQVLLIKNKMMVVWLIWLLMLYLKKLNMKN